MIFDFDLKIALVHDYLTQYGGGERVLEAFSEIWPEAPIFTLVYDARLTDGRFANKEIYTSFLQKIPLVKSKHRLFLFLMPMAIEQFDLSDYDIVLSDSASYAKGIITKPSTVHICYCHTPTRYAWDDSHRYIKEARYSYLIKKLAPLAINYIRLWDREAASRVDKFIANSHFVKKRIVKYYGRESEVIHPPVSVDNFETSDNIDDYFLMVGRFLPYKKFDLAIEAFNRLGWPLKIIGDGPERRRLLRIGGRNIEFLGIQSDEVLRGYYSHCRALIFPQEEDFGIVALEAMASGRPVIAYRAGGALEMVEEGATGLFFNEQNAESLMECLKRFNYKNFDSGVIRERALRFDKEIFKEKIRDFVEENYKEFMKCSSG